MQDFAGIADSICDFVCQDGILPDYISIQKGNLMNIYLRSLLVEITILRLWDDEWRG